MHRLAPGPSPDVVGNGQHGRRTRGVGPHASYLLHRVPVARGVDGPVATVGVEVVGLPERRALPAGGVDLEHAERAVGEPGGHHRAVLGPLVGASVGPVGPGDGVGRHRADLGHVTHQPERDRQPVRAEVADHAAARHVGIEAPCVLAFPREAGEVAHPEPVGCAEVPLVDQAFDPAHHRHVAVGERHEGDGLGPLRRLRHLRGFRHREPQRLLAQHVEPPVQCRQCDRVVAVVRRGDDHRVERQVEQLVDVGDGPRHLPPLREGGRPRRVPAGDHLHRDVGAGPQRGQVHGVGPPRRADDTDPHRHERDLPPARALTSRGRGRSSRRPRPRRGSWDTGRRSTSGGAGWGWPVRSPRPAPRGAGPRGG